MESDRIRTERALSWVAVTILVAVVAVLALIGPFGTPPNRTPHAQATSRTTCADCRRPADAVRRPAYRRNARVQDRVVSLGVARPRDTRPLGRTGISTRRVIDDVPVTRSAAGEYPDIVEPGESKYVYQPRDYKFAEVSSQEVQDMFARKAPLGIPPVEWNGMIRELHDDLRASHVADADIRLKGSSTTFFSGNAATKGFPQNVEEVKQRAIAYYTSKKNASADVAKKAAEEGAAAYTAAGFTTPPIPRHSFFNSLGKLNVDERSDYDFQLVSDTVAQKFQQYLSENENMRAACTSTKSETGELLKGKCLKHIPDLKPLADWAQDWSVKVDHEVAISVFPRTGKSPDLRDTDWIVVR
jgi:hypothetical protein